MSDIAIRVQDLSKAYRLGAKEAQSKTLVEAIFRSAATPLHNYRRLKRLDTFATSQDADDILWALKGVSFDIFEGEVVGFVGRNGAGKSTLLKILSRITEPTSGRIEIHGRVSSLLEVGTGFHPELTGRENVYMNGTILGMKKTEIDAKFDEIIDFSGVERFLDTPVKRFSSGMKVRLAFAVAAHLEPEILIVDEVLAVGDAEFQKKCLGKMQDVAGSGRTVLFVSHNLGAVQTLCGRAVHLSQGQLVADGEPAIIVRSYLTGLASAQMENPFRRDNPRRRCSERLRFTDGKLLNASGHPTKSVMAGEAVELVFHYHLSEPMEKVEITFTIFNSSGLPVTSINTALTNFALSGSPSNCIARCFIKKLPLAIGDYRVAIALHAHRQRHDLIPNALNFSVVDSVYFGSSNVPNREYTTVYVDHEWSSAIPKPKLVAAQHTTSAFQ